MKKVAIIGGGTAGCAAAHQFGVQGDWEIHIFEGGNELGAGVRTYQKGGHPFTFGPRHFLTKNNDVFEYLDKIVPLRKLNHKFLTYLDEESDFFKYPINIDDIDKMNRREKINKELSENENKIFSKPNNFEEYWVAKVGYTLYSKYIDKYSKKMWCIDDNKLIDRFNFFSNSPKGVAIKKDNTHAWSEAISAYPKDLSGYNVFFDKVKDFSKIFFKTKIQQIIPEKMEIVVSGEKQKYDIIINTISLDTLLNNSFGELPFVGRDLITIILPQEFVFPKDVFFLYYANDEPYTRIVEYKKFTQYKSNTTLIGLEIPSKNGKHYPLPMMKYKMIQDKYESLLNDKVFSIGRAGKYDYQVDIDDCIEQALDIKFKVL